MGIFSYRPRRALMEADGDDDYTSGADGAADDESNDDSGGDDDYTSGADGAADDESNDDSSDGDDDYTSGADGAADDESNDDGGDDSNGEDEDDYTVGADGAADSSSGDSSVDSEDSDDSSSDDGGSDDDYTSGAADSSESSEGSEDEGESSDGEDGESEEGAEANYEDLKKIESELFSNLTPDQVAIKNEELKQRFIDIYTTIASVLLRINDIPKTDTNISSLEFVTDKLIELRNMVDYNITKAFNTRTYIENSIVYQLCLSTLNSISQIIDSTSDAEAPENEEEIEDTSGIIYNDDSDADDPAAGEDMIAVGDRMVENANHSYINNVKLI